MIGIGNRKLGKLIPDKAWVAGGKIRGRLQELGLWRESGHEAMNGSIVVPLFSESGEVVQMYGRKVNENLRAGTPKHLYLARPLQGVWNWEAVRSHKELLVCEAALDAMTSWVAGLRNVTFTFGVEGLTEELVEAMRRYGTERVVFLFDGDEAGDRGAAKHGERLMRELGVECFRARLPRGHDVNSYARAVSDASDALSELVRRAEWMGKGTGPTSSTPARELPRLAAEPEPPPVSPIAPAPELEIPTVIDGDTVTIRLGDREYRVRGLEKNATPAAMKVTLRVSRGVGLYVDTLDLNAARARKEYATQAADELGVGLDTIKHDLGRVWLRLEQLLDERAKADAEAKAAEPSMTDQEREEALAFLRDPRLLETTLEHFARCGIVGEETNKLLGHLAVVSRKLERPLAVMIQSSSAAGKSSLMEAILSFVPEEERVKYSAMTGQSLFYMADTDLRHKVLAIVEEEGAERASYALKLLQSEGELTIASTGKDPQTGRLVTHEYRVEGPVMLLLTTTAVEIDEELLNRCIVLTVDEDREQTRAIHRMQRELEGRAGLWADEERSELRRLHRNAQRLLRPLKVMNPYAHLLTFLDDKTRTRRDHLKYLGIIRSVTLYHQYQRPIRSETRNGLTKEYVVVELADIEVANRIAHEVLGRTLDELPPQTRRFAGMLATMVEEGSAREGVRRGDYRCSQREIREYTGWSAAQVKAHLQKLVELEYVIAHPSKRGQQWLYEVLYEGEGDGGEPFLMGLLDVEGLRRSGYDRKREDESGSWEDENGGWEEAGRYAGDTREDRGRAELTSEIANNDGAMSDGEGEEGENAHKGNEAPSYQPVRRKHRSAGSEGE